MYFRDGKRRIDFVLAYRIDCLGGQAESKRRTYEANLRAKGLELEHESAEVRIGLKHLELKLVRKFTKLSNFFFISPLHKFLIRPGTGAL